MFLEIRRESYQFREALPISHVLRVARMSIASCRMSVPAAYREEERRAKSRPARCECGYPSWGNLLADWMLSRHGLSHRTQKLDRTK